MDYEKMYKAALKTAAQWIKDGCTDKEKICLECVSPELRESEDERIRKWLLECVENLSDGNFIEVSRQDVLFYLEKQKEQKPAGWKPQPESLEALMYAIEGKWDMIPPTSYLSRRLEDLYEGLVNTFNVNETLLAELPKTAYTAEDIEELRALKAAIDASMDEKPNKSLEEAAQQYAEGPECTWAGTTALEEAFKAGAKWQKEQMLKDAVEGEIQMRYSGCLCAKTIRAINEDKFKLGEKVRLIIVKEEEK